MAVLLARRESVTPPADSPSPLRAASAPPLPTPSAPVPGSYAELALEGDALGRRIVERYGHLPPSTALEATIASEAGDLTAATAAWRAHLERHPESAEGWYRLGLYAIKEGRDADAADMLARALRLDSALPDIQAHLGRCLLKLDRVDEALAVLEPAIGSDRGGAVRLFHLGHAHLARRRDEDAAAAFRASVERAPGYTGAWYGLATALDRLGRADEADTARAEFRRLKSQDAATAAANLARDEAIRMRHLLAGWYASAGRIAAQAGDAVGAEAMWRRGRAIEPAHDDLRRLLVDLYRRQGRDAEVSQLAAEGTAPPGGTEKGR